MHTFNNPKDDLGRGVGRSDLDNDKWYLVTFKTACGCKQTQRMEEAIVKQMEFLHLPIRRPRPVQPGDEKVLGSNWKFRTFKCVGVDTINHTALYEEYLP